MLLNRDEKNRVGQYRDLNTNTSSQYSSSLDLEWEHEYGAGAGGPASNQQVWLNIEPELRPDDNLSRHSSSDSSEKKDNSVECSGKSQMQLKANSWSHISTPDSMEWDVDEQDDQMKSECGDSIDQDTKDLLFEIEQLKNRVLKETGNYEYLNRFNELNDSWFS